MPSSDLVLRIYDFSAFLLFLSFPSVRKTHKDKMIASQYYRCCHRHRESKRRLSWPGQRKDASEFQGV